MSLPDFSKLALSSDIAPPPPAHGEPWLTPEGPIDLNAFRGDATALAAFARGKPST